MNAFARFMYMMLDQKEIPDRPTEVDFTDFMETLESDVKEFKLFWTSAQIGAPSLFPATLPTKEDWIEQFIVWRGTR